MKLQCNQRGSWRNVVDFPNEKQMLLEVGDAVALLARALGGRVTWRIVEDDGLTVLGYLNGPEFAWSAR